MFGQVRQTILSGAVEACLLAQLRHPFLPQPGGMKIKHLAQIRHRRLAIIELLADEVGKGRYRIDIGHLHALATELIEIPQPFISKVTLRAHICSTPCLSADANGSCLRNAP